jgi:hypothetical protein
MADHNTAVLYFSAPVTLAWSGLGLMPPVWPPPEPASYVARLAVLPPAAASPGVMADLDRGAAVYPLGGDVTEVTLGHNNNTAQFSIVWNTSAPGDLLMLALPHHQQTIRAPDWASFAFDTVVGPAVALWGSSWTVAEVRTARTLVAVVTLAPLEGTVSHRPLVGRHFASRSSAGERAYGAAREGRRGRVGSRG